MNLSGLRVGLVGLNQTFEHICSLVVLLGTSFEIGYLVFCHESSFFVIIILQSHHNFCTEIKQILEVDIILSELHVCYCMSFDSILQPCFFLSL
jgi:hypothetical protein